MQNIDTEEKEKTSKTYKRYSRLRRKLLSSHLREVRIGIVVFSFLIVFGSIFVSGKVISTTKLGNVLKMANNFLFLPQGQVLEYNGRTNILVLGKSGTGDDSPELTDTIMVATIKEDGSGIGIISIPRDIWVPELSDKINASYKLGNEEKPGGGLSLAKAYVERVVGLPIHYAVVFNYESFVDIIDALGGVNINVKKGFTDEKFPIAGKENDECNGDLEYKCRYETLVFNPGPQLMDGTTALKFSRSRHSTDLEEGTDLARAARQQQVVSAIKDKILSRDILTSPSKLLAVYNILKKDVETDLDGNEVAYLGRKVLQSKDKITKGVIPESLLYNPPYKKEFNYLYVFVPQVGDGNWSQVHQWVQDTF